MVISENTSKTDKKIDKIEKDIIKLYKQVILLNKNLIKLTRKVDSTLEIVKSFNIVLTEYVEEELSDEPEDSEWNPYEVDPEDYSGYDGDEED
jgi:hypothetical protein